ncbi:MAG: SUF system NifU family Fe-S cluster assembly protein [Gammaproteobacteria bacterium]|nr:SUF system NifU family Fe-S cluster assembly protein [Gammaproteobacteria bacterium]|tara:strand:- start:1183 stop:1659 length:477 start_codon:yes stop_codon:yes gene_type:complete
MKTQSISDIQNLYRELIIEHAHKPRNYRHLKDATHTAEGINPLCGDKLQLYIQVDKKKIIKDIGFEGSGCAISMASASLLTETIKNLSLIEANNYFISINNLLLNKKINSKSSKNIDLSKLKALEGVNQYPMRIKCATLAWHALNSAINKNSPIVTTE